MARHRKQDICVGNVLQPGGGAVMGRIAQFLAGLPYEIPLSAVNRQCSSGLQAIANIYGAIKAGGIDAGIGAGAESMSSNDMAEATPSVDWAAAKGNPLAWACTIPMGITSENVAERYGVSREDQDRIAVRSHARVAAATRAGAFVEIVPVTLAPAEEGGAPVVVDRDDGVREGTTVEGLARLKPAFKEGGSTTAGNSSQVSDGAAAVVVARRSVALAAGIAPLATMLSYAVVGVPPDEMVRGRPGLRGCSAQWVWCAAAGTACARVARIASPACPRPGRRARLCNPRGRPPGRHRAGRCRRLRDQRGLCESGASCGGGPVSPTP